MAGISSSSTLSNRYPHLAKEALITSRKRGNPENRLWAKIIDLVVSLPFLGIIQMLFPPLVLPVSLLFWTLIEGLGRGQSPGKWLLGLHTIDVLKGESPRLYNGFIRNFPFALVSAAVFKSGFLWSFAGLICILSLAFETYFVFVLRSGIRIGDILAYTRVFDYKDI
ncbi:MAG: RDD family protein, partial [Bdellovibrionota bacterium]